MDFIPGKNEQIVHSSVPLLVYMMPAASVTVFPWVSLRQTEEVFVLYTFDNEES